MSASRIALAEPCLTGNEAKYLQECVESNFVSSVGPFVLRFEHDFAAAVGAKFAVACASGTAALHIALIAAGAGPEAEVATSLLTFVASVNAIRYTGATPLLVDSERETWNLDTELLRDEVVRRARRGQALPQVIEPVHILGHPADLEPLLELRDRFGIAIVEDAAEALGAQYTAGRCAGRQVGTVGDLGCYSFNGNKIMTTGGGGMVVTDDPDLHRRVRHLSTQARLPGLAYQHDEIGFNYRMTNVAAALGVAQLERLDEFIVRKRAIAERYSRAFESAHLELQPTATWAAPSGWLSTVLVPGGEHGRDALIDALGREGIDSRPVWTPVRRHTPYADTPVVGTGDVADAIFAGGVTLPSSVGLTSDDQERTINAVLAARLRNSGEAEPVTPHHRRK